MLRHGEDGDNLCDARKHPCDALPRHYRLRIFAYTKACNVGKDTVLTQAGCQASAENNEHQERKVKLCGDMSESDG